MQNLGRILREFMRRKAKKLVKVTAIFKFNAFLRIAVNIFMILEKLCKLLDNFFKLSLGNKLKMREINDGLVD
jgi:hypothetical protein